MPLAKRNKKVAFIVPYPKGAAPGQRFRFEQYLDIPGDDFTFKIFSFLSEKAYNDLYKRTLSSQNIINITIGYLKRMLLIFRLGSFDYIYLFREATPLGPAWFEFITARILKKKIIYDFDDAIWLKDPTEKGTLLSILKWKQKVKLICRYSYKVSVGNRYLAEYAEKYNAQVNIIPTIVDTEKYHNPTFYNKINNPIPVIGWTGSHSTLNYLEPIIPVLKKVYKKKPFIFKVIANKVPDFKFDNLQFVEWSKESEIRELYTFDIGIMPLHTDQWSLGKCGFKLIQYMSLEIPSIASSVGVNKTIIDHGQNGFLCNDAGHWEQYLLLLMENKSLRQEFGSQARKKIIKHYSLQATQDDFLQLFQ